MNEEAALQGMYADISATTLALCNALAAKGLISKAELTEAFQERLLAMQPTGAPNAHVPHRLYLLEFLAQALKESPTQ